MVAALHVFDPGSDATPKRPRRRLPDFLRDDELHALLETARLYWLETTKQLRWRRARQRDYLMVMTAYHCGLRVFELCDVRVEGVDLKSRILFVRKGKNSKDRTVPIPVKLAELLKQWISDRTAGVLFTDPRGGHVDLAHFRERLRFLAKRAGIARRTSPHTLRHTFATHLLQRGATVYEVQRLLGHSSLSATVIYLHLIPGRLAEVVELL